MLNSLSLFKHKKNYISVSPSIVVFTVFFLITLYFLFQIRQILIILLMSFIVMVALNPAVNKLQKIIKSRLVSAIIVYFLVLMVLGSLLSLLLPPLVTELVQLMRSINIPYLQDELSNLRFTLQELNQFANSISSSLNTALSFINSTFQGLFTFLTLIVISFYLMLDEPKLHKKIGWFTQQKSHFRIARKFLDDIEIQLGGWIRGQIILMSVVGLITYIALTIIGVPFALPLALLAGLLEILPNLGPTLAAVPGIAIAWIYGTHVTALMTAGYYILIQQIENNLIVPKIMHENADVNPLIGILSILTGFKLGGVIGGLLAIPVYILARTIYSYYRKYEDKLKPDW